MTPRTNVPAAFSETLLQAMKEKKAEYDLKLRGPLFDLLHPKMIEAKLKYLNNPEQEAEAIQIPGWYVYAFSNLESAPKGYPIVYGQPFEIGKILNNDIREVVIDFPPLGAVLLSRSPKDIELTPGLHLHVLPVWMSYVLSPELWGTQGKWTRFHERLHQVFQQHSLLKEQDYPGFYPLHLKAKKLAAFGFEGTITETNYTLSLSWTFPLTALQHLEKVISQEF